jgi:hypothetical protein
LLSGCAIPYLIAIAVQGSGERFSRIDLLAGDDDKICQEEIAQIDEGYQAFRPISAHYSHLSKVAGKLHDLKARRFSDPRPDLIWLPAKMADRGQVYQLAQGRFNHGGTDRAATILLGRRERWNPGPIGDEFVGFSNANSFEFVLIMLDDDNSALSPEHLFKTSDLLIDLTGALNRSTRLIRLSDLNDRDGRAEVIQVVTINERPYLLVRHEITTADDAELSKKLPEGFSQNWKVDLIPFRRDQSIAPVCTYFVHTRLTLYASS